MPRTQANEVTIWYSENALVKLKVTGKNLATYNNQDILLSKGIKAHLYDKHNKHFAVLTAEQAYFDHQKNEILLTKNIVVHFLDNNEYLYTQKLVWPLDDEAFHASQGVKVTTKTLTLTGEHLTGQKDFTHYTIKAPKGTYH